MKHTPAVKVESVIDWEKITYDKAGRPQRLDLAPGSFCFTNDTSDNIAALDFVCPCGCGSVGCLPLRHGFGGDCWEWDGREDTPTLSPSIQKTVGCAWHGYLKAGVFEEC